MDFTLSDEQRAFQETARDFAHDEWLPHAPGWDAREEFPVEALRKAAALGFAGIYVRDQLGGSGLTRLDAALIFEELATACVSTAAYLSIHNMAAWMIDRFGDEAQRARFLPKLMSMEHFASYCLTEPGSGSDAAALQTRARREGEDYVLDGAKALISGGARASMEAARDYMLERRQFGQRLADFQALQFKLADMATGLDAARLMLRRAAASLDKGDPDATLHCAMAKRLATDAGFRVCDEALQLHGGYGYLRDFPIERYLRDVRVHQILEGTNEIMRVIIARRLLRQ